MRQVKLRYVAKKSSTKSSKAENQRSFRALL